VFHLYVKKKEKKTTVTDEIVCPMSLEGFDYCQNSEFITIPSKIILACIVRPTKEILNGVFPPTRS